jgi:hypothetical protein
VGLQRGELSPNVLVTEGLRRGSNLSFRSDNLDSVSEPYTEYDFRQLPVAIEPAAPLFLVGTCAAVERCPRLPAWAQLSDRYAVAVIVDVALARLVVGSRAIPVSQVKVKVALRT